MSVRNRVAQTDGLYQKYGGSDRYASFAQQLLFVFALGGVGLG